MLTHQQFARPQPIQDLAMRHLFTLTTLLLLLTGNFLAAGEANNHPYLKVAAKSLVGADGKQIDQAKLLKPKYVLIYFSAHWCPPCRAFTPKLVNYYNEKGGGKDFEILFVSSDEDSTKMGAYMKETSMPWAGLRFGSSKTADIQKKYGGKGIPCLTVLDDKDEAVLRSYVDGQYVGPQHVLAEFSKLIKDAK